jgi:hypothetical protein
MLSELKKFAAGTASILFLVVLWAICCFGQTQILGTISGAILDPTGAAVPDASVVLTNKDTNQSQTTTTNGEGRYVFSDLSPGTYEVASSKPGFQQCVNAGVNLVAGAHIALSCNMQVGAVSEKVVVEASPAAVQTEDTRVSRLVTSQQMQNMPVNGGNFASLMALQPGVDQEFSYNSFQGMNIFATESTHVNGLRGDDTALLVEGDPSTRTRGGAAEVAPPPIDAIDEINIVSTGYMPEYARSGGGQVLIQIKSGTSTYHGSVYENLRNNDFDAKNFFSSTVSPLHYNNFGFTLGGPVIPRKNKVFFFYSSDWQRLAQTSTNVATVPTPLARSGNFSEYCAAGLPCPKVPAYLNGIDGLVGGAPFPNNTIPASLFSPNGAAMVNVMALPNLPGLGNNNVQEIPTPQNGATEVAKVDVYLDKIKSRLSVTARHYRTDSINDTFSGSSRVLNWELQNPGRAASADLTTTFSPTLLNDFSLTYSQDIVHVILPSGPGLNRTALGITYPYIFGPQSKDIAEKTPQIDVSGFDQVGQNTDAYPSGSDGAVVQLQDVITKVSGQHTFKYGVWVAEDGENDHDQLQIGNQSLNGRFNFNAASSNPFTTGAPLADALLGNFDSYTEFGYRNNTPWRSNQFGAFWQDTWKVTKDFTLSGGLRWDYFSPYRSNWCNFSVFDQLFYSRTPGVQQVVDPITGQVTSGDPYNGVVAPCNALPASGEGHFGVFGEGFNSSTASAINQELKADGIIRGLSQSIYPSRWNNWQPRLGFSWDPTGHGTTSIRAAAGIFTQHDTLNDGTLLGKNVPFQTAETVYNGVADCPGSALSATHTCLSIPGAAPPIFPIPISAGDLTGAVPQVYQWNANVQHQFGGNVVVEVGYVGTRGRHLVIIPDLNQLPIGVGAAALAAIPGANLAAFAPYPGFGTIQDGLNEANSRYDSLQVSVQKRMSNGLQFGLSYTYSHSYDDGSSRTAAPADTYNLAYDWGPSDWERKNILLFNYYYELPWFKNRHSLAAEVVGGWALGGVFTFETGVPYTATDSGADIAEVNDDNNQYVNVISGCNPNSGPKLVSEWFNTACFAMPTPGTFGNAGRNTIWGPHIIDWDLTLNKGGLITEKLRWQFRAQLFNILNHPSFGCNNCLDSGISDSNFGFVTGATDPREIQLSLRLSF